MQQHISGKKRIKAPSARKRKWPDADLLSLSLSRKISQRIYFFISCLGLLKFLVFSVIPDFINGFPDCVNQLVTRGCNVAQQMKKSPFMRRKNKLVLSALS